MHEGIQGILGWLQGGRAVEFTGLAVRDMPLLYRSCYRMLQGEIGGVPVVLAEDRHSCRLTPGTVAKHMAGIAAHTGRNAVYASERITAQDARRMLAKGVAFISGGGNVFLPFITLRLTGKPKPAPTCTALGMPAQLLVLGALNHKVETPLTYEAAQRFLPFSRASVHTAFEQLQLTGLARRMPARCVQLEFVQHARALWERALPLLQNPSRRTVELDRMPNGLRVCLAGESALAERTMLAAPREAVSACALHDYLRLPHQPAALPSAAGDTAHLQLWLHSPSLIGGDGVDPLSLYLTLRQNADERVQQALEQLLDEFPW